MAHPMFMIDHKTQEVTEIGANNTDSDSDSSMLDTSDDQEILDAFEMLSAPPRPVLIWDLDETLVHCISADTVKVEIFVQYVSIAKQESLKPFLQRQVFHVCNPKENINVIIILRPHLRSSLKLLQNKYSRQIVFSAGHAIYVKHVVDLIYDPLANLQRPLLILNWYHCSVIPNATPSAPLDYVKNLWTLVDHFPQFNFQIENLILLDNRVENARYTPLQLIKVDDYVPTIENQMLPNDSFLRDVLPGRIAQVDNFEHYRNRVQACKQLRQYKMYYNFPSVLQQMAMPAKTVASVATVVTTIPASAQVVIDVSDLID